jgi:hypothetical protein
MYQSRIQSVCGRYPSSDKPVFFTHISDFAYIPGHLSDEILHLNSTLPYLRHLLLGIQIPLLLSLLEDNPQEIDYENVLKKGSAHDKKFINFINYDYFDVLHGVKLSNYTNHNHKEMLINKFKGGKIINNNDSVIYIPIEVKQTEIQVTGKYSNKMKNYKFK